MKIRLPILATALAPILALAPGLSQASTLYEKYVEYIYYDFTYFFPHSSVAVEEFWNPDTEQWYKRASLWDDPGGYICLDPKTGERDWDNDYCYTEDLIEFGFYLEGSEIVPLDNLTFDLKALPETVGGYAATFYSSLLYFTDDDDCYSEHYGSIGFGPTGEIASYDMGYFYCDWLGVFANSNARLLTDLFGDEIDTMEDADLLEGVIGYDNTYLVPGDLYYAQRPGYWQTSITRWCYYETYYDEFEVPCRENNGVTPEPTTPIPLPAAGWLLLGGLGLLGAARRRRG